jgi:uncharacterized damage-inducible protein DinB
MTTNPLAERPIDTSARERADLLSTLAKHRGLLRFTVRELTDEQARRRTTVSELTLGGLIKHVAHVERGWADFVRRGPEALGDQASPEGWQAHANSFRMTEQETLDGVLARYAEVAAATDDLVRSVPDLGHDHPLPEAPWFPPGERWSARRVFLHVVAETAQHAGHADLLREALDGAKSMG